MYLEEILAGGKSFFTNIHVLSVIKQGISAIRNKEPAGELVLLKLLLNYINREESLCIESETEVGLRNHLEF